MAGTAEALAAAYATADSLKKWPGVPSVLPTQSPS